MDELNGLSATLDYVRILEGEKPLQVLDIGAGTGRGIQEIANSSIGQGLQFKGTVLKTPEHSSSSVELIATSAERLRTVERASIAGIISVYGIAYSDLPEVAGDMVNWALVRGGVFKGVFPLQAHVHQWGILKPFNEFAGSFYKHNFEVARYAGEHDNTERILAIKMPAIGMYGKALELLMEDMKHKADDMDIVKQANMKNRKRSSDRVKS